jgi:hypothetical protein
LYSFYDRTGVFFSPGESGGDAKWGRMSERECERKNERKKERRRRRMKE